MKGTTWKKRILLLLCLTFLMAGVSCNNDQKEPVILRCNNIDITESIYRMYLYEAGSALKSKYVPEYTDEEYASLSKEEREAYYELLDHFWTTEIDGRMPFEIVRENALTNLKSYAFYKDECKKNNVSMTEEELRSFTAQMELYHKDSLDKIEGWFGVTREEYISYLAEIELISAFIDIQASGISVSTEEIEKKFQENRKQYAKVVVQTIFLKVTEEQEKAQQEELAKQLKARMEKGEDINALVKDYSDYSAYEDGSMIVTGQSDLDKHLGNGFVENVLQSKEDTVAVVETDMGYCIVKTVSVEKVKDATVQLKAMIQNEKYINKVKSIVGNNKDYTIETVEQELYDAITDVPEILK